MQNISTKIIDYLNSDKDDLFEIGDARFVPMDKENNPELKSEKFTVQQGMLELSNS